MPAKRPALGLEGRIHELRGLRVMLSSDLAELYAVEPRALIQAVKRNPDRFPPDFMFHVTAADLPNLKSQIVISSHGGARSLPYAFTEQGVAMLSSVLRSPRAIAVNVEIMRAFVRLRAMAWSVEELSRKLATLERRYDAQFKIVFDAIRQLMQPREAAPERPQIGFRSSSASWTPT